MKNIFLYIALAFLGFTSCNDPSAEVYNPADGQIAYFTDGTTKEYYVQDIPSSETTIEVGVTVASNVDRTIALNIDESSTATADQYTIDNASLFIPANKYVGYIKVKLGVYTSFSQTVPSTVVLNLNQVSGAVVADFDNQFILNVYQYTPFVREDMLGTYSVVEYETVDGVEERVDSYESEVIAGDNESEVIMGNIYNADPGTQTILILDDSDPFNFQIKFPPFLQNYLFDGGTANGDVFVEGFPGKFSAGLKTLDFTYRLRFGVDNTGSSETGIYRVHAEKL
jgi:hypothetical protein